MLKSIHDSLTISVTDWVCKGSQAFKLVDTFTSILKVKGLSLRLPYLVATFQKYILKINSTYRKEKIIYLVKAERFWSNNNQSIWIRCNS